MLEMDKRRAINAAVFLAVVAFLTLPAGAQNPADDPRAHDWYKEQVQPKTDPTTPGKTTQASSTPATGTNTGTTAPATPTPNSPNDILKQSLGGVKSDYHGEHQWYKDDQVGLIVVAVLAAFIILAVWLASKKTKGSDQGNK